jgi:putative membrane protein
LVDTMHTLAEKFLTPEEQKRITQCVRQAEQRTSGEIVPMVVSASHDYPLASITGAALIALPAGVLLTRIIGNMFWIDFDRMWLFIACFCVVFLLCRQIIKHLPGLLRLFLSDRQAEEEVRRAATMAFFTERLYKTKAENGILLYISIFEQRVWVLGDRGINERLDQQCWQEIVSLVTHGVKNRRQCEAICEAIDRIGDILEQAFPIQADDKNELHNLIIR